MKVNLIGRKFGMLTVKKYSHTKNYRQYWLCKCDCGGEKITATAYLQNGQVKSCGCAWRQKDDLTGQVFDRLKVLSFDCIKNKKTYWLCQCECGKIKTIRADSLTSGKTQSCGCLNAELSGNRSKKHGDARRGKMARLHSIWGNMKQRCENPKNDNYSYYGDRGIKICPEWQDYLTFKKWALQNGYSDNLSIDRIDVNGNYEPSNCRWVTQIVQANNTRANHFLTYGGETKTLAQWARYFGVLPTSINTYRHRNKCSYDDALNHFADYHKGGGITRVEMLGL